MAAWVKRAGCGLVLASAGCNALWGLDELDFERGGGPLATAGMGGAGAAGGIDASGGAAGTPEAGGNQTTA
jgi:hypothetical protein